MNQRLSNIELLRCLSMFMVLLLHSSFLAFGMPDVEAIQSNPVLLGGANFTTGSRHSFGRCLRVDFGVVFYKT